MIQRVIIFTEYWFMVSAFGNDHMEGNQWAIDKKIGKGIVHFHNKKGGILRLMFLGEPSTTKKASIIRQVEDACHLKFIDQKEVQYLAEYERNLRSMYGDKLIIK